MQKATDQAMSWCPALTAKHWVLHQASPCAVLVSGVSSLKGEFSNLLVSLSDSRNIPSF